MSYKKGRDFLIYVESATTADTFLKIGACRELTWSLSNGEVDITNKDSAGNRELLEGAFNLAVSISASGVYNDTGTVMEEVRGYAKAGTHKEYIVVLPDTNNNLLRCTAQITSLEFSGADGEISYSIALSGTNGYTDTTTGATLV